MIPNFITAGSGDAMLNIVRRLDRSRFAPAVCVLRKGGTLDAAIEEMGIPFLEAPMLVEPRPLWGLRASVRQAAVVFRPYGFQLWHPFHCADDCTEPLVARAAGDFFRGHLLRDKARHLPPHDLVSRSGVVVLLADFFRAPFKAGRGYTVSMLLTFSAWLERHA